MRLILTLLISIFLSQAFTTKSLHFNLPNESAEITAKLVEIIESVESHASLELESDHNHYYFDFLVARNSSLEAYRYKSNHGNIEIYLNHFRQIHSSLPPPLLS